ncbi:MAG TPA: TonB-dependent receptor [Terriglobales bacterium]|nr:TonB-dependent receptor [Terriglobales bacterium]
MSRRTRFTGTRRFVSLIVALALVVGISAVGAFAQRLDGTLTGVVDDSTGAVLQGAKVTATNDGTGIKNVTETTSSGTYNFPNLLSGTYTVTVEKSGFKRYVRRNVVVRSNLVTEANARMEVGGNETTVEVTAGAEVVQTTSSTLAANFDSNMVVNLPIPTALGTNGALNLATFAPGTTTQGGGVLGTGGSIGGVRPRFNNFTVDGVDDNRVDITGPQSNVIPDAIAEFNLITNQFSAEYGHSAGGQFATVTKSGTNNWHGTASWTTNNRNFNAFDNIQKGACPSTGPCEKPRTDFNVGSGTVGGPIIKNKLFIFGAYQRTFAGFSGTSASMGAPNASGLQNLNALAEDQAVKDILAQFPNATGTVGTTNVTNTRTGVTLPVQIGTFNALLPAFYNEHDYHINGDLNIGKHQFRTRYLYNRQRQPDIFGQPSQFIGSQFFNVHKATVTDVWAITDRFINDVRASYTRQFNGFAVPSPFENFPNVQINDPALSNFLIGPDGNAPQGGGQNVYQLLDQMSYIKGHHSLKWGAESRRWIAPAVFLPRARGEWQYSTLGNLINDTVPIDFAKRGAGSGQTDGNQTAAFGFVQDDWKITPRVTVNLGIRYEWFGIPNMARTQALNAISTLPNSPFNFRVPVSDTNNWAPRFGFAWDVFGDGKTALRGGFGVSYDVFPQNFPSLQLPPQLQSEQDPDITCSLPGRPSWCANYNSTTYAQGGQTGRGFLQNGGLLQVNIVCATQADCRNNTQGIMNDLQMPKVFNWTLGVQRQVWKNASIEARYLGTRGVELLTQTQLNAQTAFAAGGTPIPTFLSTAAVPTTFPAGAPTLAAVSAFSVRPYPQFAGPVTGFLNNAYSIYHGASADFVQRMTHGLSLRANYTWAHTIDTGTNELFSSLVNPRRGEDGQNIQHERGRSVLDIRHKGAITWVYEFRKMNTSNPLMKALLDGWEWNGTYLIQTGQPVNARSATDTNLNKDSAGDRAILNPAGDPFKSTDVNLVCWNGTTRSIVSPGTGCAGGAAQVVGYVAVDPTAGFVRARAGTLTNTGRNTLTSDGRNNWDMSFFKNYHFGETKNLQFRAEFFNIFNHRQYSFANPGVFAIAGIDSSAIDAESFVDVNGNPNFRNPKQLNGGSRNIQFGLKFIF